MSESKIEFWRSDRVENLIRSWQFSFLFFSNVWEEQPPAIVLDP